MVWGAGVGLHSSLPYRGVLHALGGLGRTQLSTSTPPGLGPTHAIYIYIHRQLLGNQQSAALTGTGESIANCLLLHIITEFCKKKIIEKSRSSLVQLMV